jgi:short-subunit dehydrogenase
MNTEWKGKMAVITGASSGIGAATARKLAAQGLRVILVARRRSRLSDLAREITRNGGKAHVIAADLTRENERAELIEKVNRRFGCPDLLVNNAGFGWYGYGFEMPWETARDMLEVNLMAMVQLSLAFLGKMRQRDSGHIINVGSISGSLPSQGVAVYGATKSFMDNFTTALYRELRGARVHVSVVRAGPVRTEFGQAALQHKNGLHVPTERIGLTPEIVADRIWGLIRRPRRVIYLPRWLCIVPWVELTFGWLIDRLGPLLLWHQSPPDNR